MHAQQFIHGDVSRVTAMICSIHMQPRVKGKNEDLLESTFGFLKLIPADIGQVAISAQS